MEPIEDKNSVPRALSQTSKRYIVMPPLASLSRNTDETGGNTSYEIPAGVSTLSSEDFTWYSSSSRGQQATAPYAPDRGQQVTAPSTPSPVPAQKPPTPRQQEDLSPARLVRTIAKPTNHGEGTLFSQATSNYRWEEQTFRYPDELLQIMETETREMQVLTTDSSAAVKPKRKSRQRKKRQIPEMRQVTAVECGAACLAMVLNYYGYATSITAVQERCGVGRDGLTALEIVKSARLYGLRVRAVSLNLDDFRYVALPAIVHWEFNHFLIVERWSPNRIDVVDPALGRRRLTRAEFDESFTGVAMLLEPGAQFEQKAPQKGITPWSYMRSLLHMRTVLSQIIGTSLLLQVLGLGAPLLTEVVIDRILPQKDPNMLMVLAVGMLILILMQGLTGFLRSSLLIYLQTRVDTDMMLNFFEHLLSLPYRFFQLRLNGDLLARVNSNLAIRDMLTNQLISTLLDGGTVIVYFIILFSFSHLIAEVSLVIGFVQIVLLLVTSPAVRRLTQRDLEAQGKTQGYMNEILSGIATLKAAGAEQRAFARWENLFYDEMNISLRLSYLSSVVGSIVGIVNLLSPLLLLWIGAMLVINGTMAVGEMLALDTLAIQFLVPLGSLAGTSQELQIIRAHFSRVADVIGTQPEQDPATVKTPHKLKGLIELRHVSFRYDQNAPLILNDINGKIFPGQKVALVGKTGSGKSTLGKLLVGLILPTKGAILYDGVPLDQLNYQDVRNQFGVVLQESFIFSGSVKDNIALNNPAMDMERVIEAASIAAIDEDIEKMPMGYDTLVSEGGSAFSGGQRQRLALARALAHHPSLLLLDEATSALDVVTEHSVEQNLGRLPCTQIIIAHRLSTIRNANLILVLDQGRIVEQGTHEQLLRRNGFYAHLIQTQLQNGEIAAR
jgi:ATP-binding cassette, subfamily B, bacterial